MYVSANQKAVSLNQLLSFLAAPRRNTFHYFWGHNTG
jgi:hypothetical protein